MAVSRSKPFTPSAEQMALWPEVSGNTLNGVGETEDRRPTPIYWHEPERTPHGRLQDWFRARAFADESMAAAKRRAAVLKQELPPVAPDRREAGAEDWTREVKAVALEAGADLIGIAETRPEWVFEGFDMPFAGAVMIAVAHDYERLDTAPSATALAEIIDQYGRGNVIAKAVAGWIREQGWDAHAHGGPDAGPMLLIPPAVECGFGELGKHGSMISRQLGSNFRLAAVFTDLPLNLDRRDDLGVDDFCANCRVCEDACPPDAIYHQPEWVRGTKRWYVDFDLCLPYFNEAKSCGICIAKCPWSLPGVAPRLGEKRNRRRTRTKG